MHITLESDYAVRIMVFLAKEKKRVDASRISQNTGVSLRFALKILRNLVACGITKSFKGTQGGYELNKTPEDITLREILQAIEGEYVFSRCLLSDRSGCTNPGCKDGACKANAVFDDISKTVRKMLEQVTLADLL